jgi:hypothetical protein
MVVSIQQHDNLVGVVLAGCERDQLRRAAFRLCTKRFGAREWRLREESFRPAMVSGGGRVRLWEGYFELEPSPRAESPAL